MFSTWSREKVRGTVGKEEISASFDMEIFAVSWTWYRSPFSEPPVFFYSFRGNRGISEDSAIFDRFPWLETAAHGPWKR
jgi:hypothetical protein